MSMLIVFPFMVASALAAVGLIAMIVAGVKNMSEVWAFPNHKKPALRRFCNLLKLQALMDPKSIEHLTQALPNLGTKALS